MDDESDYNWKSIKETEAWKRGVKQFGEGARPKPKSVEPIWLVKTVSQKEYNSKFQYNNSYLKFKGTGKGIGRRIEVGMLGAKMNYDAMNPFEKADYRIMNDEELRTMDSHCRSHNIFPRPLKEQ